MRASRAIIPTTSVTCVIVHIQVCNGWCCLLAGFIAVSLLNPATICAMQLKHPRHHHGYPSCEFECGGRLHCGGGDGGSLGVGVTYLHGHCLGRGSVLTYV